MVNLVAVIGCAFWAVIAAGLTVRIARRVRRRGWRGAADGIRPVMDSVAVQSWAYGWDPASAVPVESELPGADRSLIDPRASRDDRH